MGGYIIRIRSSRNSPVGTHDATHYAIMNMVCKKIWHLAISCSLMSLLQNTINKKCLQFSINSDQIYQRKSSTDFLTVSNILENLITVTVPSAAIHQALNTTEFFVCFTTKWYQFKLLLQEFLCNFRWYL